MIPRAILTLVIAAVVIAQLLWPLWMLWRFRAADRRGAHREVRS